MAAAAQAVVMLCEFCETEVEDMYFCVSCQQNMCSQCRAHHLRGKKTRNDKVILLSEAQELNLVKSPVIHCTDHIEEEVTLYCSMCDALICADCLSDKHVAHNVTSLKELKNTKRDQLIALRDLLSEKKTVYEKAIETEGKVHSEYIVSIDKIKVDIDSQKNKIIAELSSICDQQFAEILSLEVKEKERHNETCAKLKSQTQEVVSALLCVQKGIGSHNAGMMVKAVAEASAVLQGLEDYSMPELKAPKFHRGCVNRQAILQALGTIQKGGKPIIKNSKFDTSKMKLLLTIEVKGTARVIKTIVPMNDGTMWVASTLDKCLTLLDKDGKYIKKSVKLVKSAIDDAKEFDDDLLVTSTTGHKVMKLTGNGKTCSVFTNLYPNKTWGLCVTHEMNVLVCLQSGPDDDSKIVKLGRSGEIILTLHNDKKGTPLFTDPYRLTSLSTGEIIITECKAGKIICIDKHGRHKFTWTADVLNNNAEVEGADDHPFFITHDGFGYLFITYYDRNKVYVVAKDGSDAKRFDNLDLEDPMGIAVNNDGKLLVGCRGGKIHVIQY